MVALVSPRPQPVEGEPGAPAVEGRVGQGGGRELDATQLVHVLQNNCVGCWGGRVGSQWSRITDVPKFIAVARVFLPLTLQCGGSSVV